MKQIIIKDKLTKQYLRKRALEFYKALKRRDREKIYELYYEKERFKSNFGDSLREQKSVINWMNSLFKNVKNDTSQNPETVIDILDFSNNKAATGFGEETGLFYLLQIWVFRNDDWFIHTVTFTPSPSWVRDEVYQRRITTLYSEITSQTLEAKNQIH